MSSNKQELEKFLQELAKNTSMQEKLKQSAQNVTSEAEVNQLFLNQAETAGYNVDPGDMESVIQKAKQKAESSELTDESLEQVNGGFLATTGLVLSIVGIIAGTAVAAGSATALVYESK